MKVIVQRSGYARVSVDDKVIAQIDEGMVLLVGICKDDHEETIKKMAYKIAHLRMYADENDKINLNIQQVKQAILSVSQFTLCASLAKGHRPSFDKAMEPERAKQLYELFNDELRQYNIDVKSGVFQANMNVLINNDGPLTFHIEID